jgi:stage II sporulation protein P
MNRRRFALAIAVVLVLALAGTIALFAWLVPSTGLRQRLMAILSGQGGELSSGFCTLVDGAGNVLLETGVSIRRGDVFIDPSGRSHRVIRLIGRKALTTPATEQGISRPRVDLASGGPAVQVASASASAPVLFGADGRAESPQAIPLGTTKQVIVLYHTHSDESYLPDDGASSIYAGGGVYRIGGVMASALSDAGFTVVHDQATHDPHDGGAYPRSRRTILQNLQYGPTLIFDIHRDSAPSADYVTTINSEETARILIVIGGGNPLYRGNLSVARSMKATADNLYPGLVRGILISGGSFNQDLSPVGLLLEIGTESLTRVSAERAAGLWADVTAVYLGPPGPEGSSSGGG